MQALAEALAAPGSELYRGASFGTTQQQWRQCGVLVQKNAWQYTHANGMGVASTAARQLSDGNQQGQQQQQAAPPEHDTVQLQLLPRAPPALVPQPGFGGPVQPELVLQPNLPLLPVVQPAPAPLGLELLQQEVAQPAEPAAPEGDHAALWPNGASLRLEDFSFGRSIEMLPMLGSLEGLPSLGQLLEEPLMNISMRMMSIREDDEFHWTDPAAAAASAAAAAMAGAAQQQQLQAGGAGGPLPPGASAFAGLPPISTGADGGGLPGPLGLVPSSQGSGELEGELPFRSVSFRDLGRGPAGPDQGGTPSSTRSTGGQGGQVVLARLLGICAWRLLLGQLLTLPASH